MVGALARNGELGLGMECGGCFILYLFKRGDGPKRLDFLAVVSQRDFLAEFEENSEFFSSLLSYLFVFFVFLV